MSVSVDSAGLPPDRIAEIVRVQVELATFGSDIGALTTFLADRARELTDAPGVIVALLDGEELVTRAASGTARGRIGLRLRRDRSLSGLCVAEARVLRGDDVETDARVDIAACREIGARSIVAAPLGSGGVTIGALLIVSPDPGAFSDRDAAVLKLVGDLAATEMLTATGYDAGAPARRAAEDPSTGLPNRAGFFDRLRRDLEAARRDRLNVAVVSVGLDGLPPVGDAFPKTVRDAVMRETGRRVRATLRDTDTAAVMGGGEFGFILTDIGDSDRARLCVDRLSRAAREPVMVGERLVRLGARTGLAMFPADGRDEAALVERAERESARSP